VTDRADELAAESKLAAKVSRLLHRVGFCGWDGGPDYSALCNCFDGDGAYQTEGIVRPIVDLIRRVQEEARKPLVEALRRAQAGCGTCGGSGSYATPVHVCRGDPEVCSRRCPEPEETLCQHCDEIERALAEAEGEPTAP